ncbi:MAG: hypothetical protein AB2L07_04925 [Thermoanaerobaculaceae bacterium]
MHPTEPTSLVAAMRAALDARAWDRGLELAEELCETAPEDPRGWVGRALCLARMGRVAEAQPVARRGRPAGAGRCRGTAPGGPTSHAFRRPPATPAVPVPATLIEEEAAAPTPTPPEAAAGPAPLHWPIGTVLDGRWEVRGSARGGMGEVVFVHDREIGRMAAVKTPLPDQLASEEGRARFVREAEAWIGLGLHPNVCSAYFVHPIAGGAPPVHRVRGRWQPRRLAAQPPRRLAGRAPGPGDPARRRDAARPHLRLGRRGGGSSTAASCTATSSPPTCW